MNDTVEYEDDNAGDLADEIEMQMAEVGDDELQSEKVEWKKVVVFAGYELKTTRRSRRTLVGLTQSQPNMMMGRMTLGTNFAKDHLWTALTAHLARVVVILMTIVRN